MRLFVVALTLTIQAGESPGPRAHHQLIWNDDAGTVRLIGGGTPSPDGVITYGDMWRLESDAWVREDVPAFPRAAHRVVDAGPLGVLLFGGTDGGVRSADPALYRLEDGAWREIASAPAAAGGEPGMCYDHRRETVVLYGGAGTGGINSTVVEWDGERVVEIDASRPGGRIGHAFVWEAHGETCLLHGGRDDGGTLRDDTWRWDGDEWELVSVEGPGARFLHTAVADSFRGRVVLFGGQGADLTLLGDTWTFDGDDWRQVAGAEGGPSPRMMGGMAASPDGIVLFGGRAANPEGGRPLYRDRADTWQLIHGTWRKLN